MDQFNYPFSAIVGQEDMKTALLINAVDPGLGGVLIQGDKGTAKTTAVRALPAVLPNGKKVIELPLNATEDRVVGTVDLGRLMQDGTRRFEPGLLSEADGNILFVDEVNLLDDHLVDLLLDAAATGRTTVERDGVSYAHPARFILVGTMNPEEGTLRPQLLDRFGLSVAVSSSLSGEERAEVVRRRLAFDRFPEQFLSAYEAEENALSQKLQIAVEKLPDVSFSDEVLTFCSGLCAQLGVDGYRADITTTRAACALAALDDRTEVTEDDILEAARYTLAHRLKRRPFEEKQLTEELLQEAAGRLESSPEEGSESEEDPSLPEVQVEAAEVSAAFPDGIALKASSERRGKTLSESTDPARGKCIGSTSDPASGKVHPVDSIRSQLLHGEDTEEGVREENLRYQRLSGNSGAKILFLIDSSGSMLNRKKMEVVKGCILSLLKDSYHRRDQIALISYGGKFAQLLLPYTSSPEMAAEQLKYLKSGGGTPLADALKLADQFLEQNGANEVFLFSDGKYDRKKEQDPEKVFSEFGEHCAVRDISLTLLDAEPETVRSLHLAKGLAEQLHARYLSLREISEEAFLEQVKGVLK